MSEAVWHVAINGKTYGPYTPDDIRKRIEKNRKNQPQPSDSRLGTPAI